MEIELSGEYTEQDLQRSLALLQGRALRTGGPLFQGTVTGLVTDEALELRSEQSEGRIKWAAFVQYKMTGEEVLLYQNNAAASILPRGFFAGEEDWQQFRQFIRATVPEKAQTQGKSLWLWLILACLVFIAVVATIFILLASL